MIKILLLIFSVLLTGCSSARYEAAKSVSNSQLCQLAVLCSQFQQDNNKLPDSIGELIDYDERVIYLILCPAAKRPYKYHGEGLRYVKLNSRIELVRSPYLDLPLNASKVPLFSIKLNEGDSLTIYVDYIFDNSPEFN